MQELRTAPRQRRSRQSIDAILDAAEQLIHEQGQWRSGVDRSAVAGAAVTETSGGYVESGPVWPALAPGAPASGA